MLLNKRQLEKLKEQWWKSDKKCEKVEDQSDGISIQNIGGVFIVIFVGIGMACVTLVFEYWWYKYKKNPKVIDVNPVEGAFESNYGNMRDNKTDYAFKMNEERIERTGLNAKLRTRTNQQFSQNPSFKARF